MIWMGCVESLRIIKNSWRNICLILFLVRIYWVFDRLEAILVFIRKNNVEFLKLEKYRFEFIFVFLIEEIYNGIVLWRFIFFFRDWKMFNSVIGRIGDMFKIDFSKLSIINYCLCVVF